ncbi:MAG TPA: recombinase family protein [Candidatus Cybelea sp.]|jgi:DNA invertase Pin-like site-specific DNA recombinase|nr:recombinase family protein [Candidatus Cybelea sp.]
MGKSNRRIQWLGHHARVFRRGFRRKGTREILSNLIDELERTAKAARPKRVLMIRIDRVGRMALDCIAAVARLRKLGVMLHTRQDGDVKLDTALDSLRPIFELVTAEMENAARSDKWKAVRTSPRRG